MDVQDTQMGADNVADTATAGAGAPGQDVDTGAGAQPDSSAGTPPTDNVEFSIPDAYQDKGWAQNIKSTDDLWKNYSNAQDMIGKKALSLNDATPEQLTELYQTVRPESVEAYTFPEGMDEAESQLLGNLLFDNGISEVQGNKLIETFGEIVAGKKEEMFSKEGMTEVLKESFGDNYDARSKDASKLLKSNLTEADVEVLETLPNQHLALLYRFADKMREQYGASESGAQAEGGTTGATVDVKGKRAELNKQLQELTSKPHKAEDKAELMRQLEATYK